MYVIKLTPVTGSFHIICLSIGSPVKKTLTIELLNCIPEERLTSGFFQATDTIWATYYEQRFSKMSQRSFSKKPSVAEGA